MARTARITKVDRRGSRCTLVRWRGSATDKGELEIPGGIQEFRQWIREQLKDSSETLIAIALAHWLTNHPGEGADFSAIEGKLITLDLSQPATSGIVTVA